MPSDAALPAPAGAPPPWLARYPADVDWHRSFTPVPLHRILEQSAARYGTRTCTNFLGRTTNYSDTARIVDATAAGLQALGVGKGTRVGLFLPNCPTFIIYYYAVLKIGGIVVNFNPLYTVEELAFQARDSGTELMVTLDLKILYDKVAALMTEGVLPRAVVCSFTALLPPTKAVLYRLFKGRDLARVDAAGQAERVILGDRLANGTSRPLPVEIDPNDVAVLQYTGGTTGTPKGAMLTHANLVINTLQVASWAPDLKHGEERVLAVLPFFHVFAMTVVMNYGIQGAAEMIIMPRFVLDDALKLIDKTKPTIMPGVPTLFNAIMNHPKVSAFDLSSLKFCLSGGAPLPMEVKEEFEARTGCKVVEGYGLTEASPVVTCNPMTGPTLKGSIGLPMPGTYLSLRHLDDPTREVVIGERGEICVKGPQVMRGYWQKPEETANQFVGEWLRTGDVGIMDPDGFVTIVDRIKDLIICSGYNVYPRRIEDAIYSHPAVEEVTVIGIPDEYRGEAPKAFVKLKAGQSLTAAELLQHLEVKISKIELPSEIEFRDALPKTMIGKLSKKELKAEEIARRKAT